MTPLFAIIDTPIIIIIVGLGVLLFGADKIPKLARSMGEAKKQFEAGSRGENPQPPQDQTPPATPPSAPPSQPPQQ
ncbi:MAG TPA: twin-arginine translocase TatA/TatE family subunit [Candidatus Eremiobacteraceae bacterium]|nr:twin-arginine translocase TatA/TatE family subunit [Candidatus Eremiobacteraceae bacterium]